jgi:elongation factor P
MISTSDFKRGLLIEVDGHPFQILDVAVQTPTARGGNTLVKLKLRNMLTKAFADKTYKAGDRVEESDFERRNVEYLYADGSAYHFMDQENYEQFAMQKEDLGNDALYLHDGIEGLLSYIYNGNPVGVELPASVTLKIEQTDPTLKGATAQAQTKPATLETGLVIQVPPYLETGETIKVDTRSGLFLERVRK